MNSLICPKFCNIAMWRTLMMPMSCSLTGTSSLYNNVVEGEVIGLRPIGHVNDLPIEKTEVNDRGH
jgi:hypothetical protein